MRRKNMKKTNRTLILISFLTITLMIGCGGGGGGGNNNGNGTMPPTKAVVKISTLGSPSVTPLIGAQATLHLPAGVSVKTFLNSTQTGTNVVVASGYAVPADLVLGVYSSASGTVNVYVTKASGFASGEFATVNCDIASGASPIAANFSVTDLIVSDSNGNLITGLTPSIAVTFQ
jgi:hypothetical protein